MQALSLAPLSKVEPWTERATWSCFYSVVAVWNKYESTITGNLACGITAMIWSAIQPLQGQAASLVVTTLANSGTGSLRTAIAIANAGDVISFA